MDIREEIPIKSFSIAAYVCRILGGRGQYLILKRCTPYLNNSWQMVSGKIEKGETAWQAAMREIREETGVVPDRLYSADAVELFYEAGQNCINLSPVFVGFLDSDQPVRTSSEHAEHKWIAPEETGAYLIFEHQRRTIQRIEELFVRQLPLEFLRIRTG